MEDLSPRQMLVALLAQDTIEHKKIWAKEALKNFVQAIDALSHIEGITLHEAFMRNIHIPEVLSARLGDDLAVQADFDELAHYVQEQIERTSVLRRGPFSEQSDREQDALVEHIVEGIDIEIEVAQGEVARQRELANTVVRPNTPVNHDLRRAQIIDVSELRGRSVSD